MANHKWIPELHAKTSLRDAARLVLDVRLQVVRDYVPLALGHWRDDPENVHQLRVGTRRGGAALAIFSMCLPSKIHKKLKGHLRDLRRAVGEARNWDVFSLALCERQQNVGTAEQYGLDFLVGYAQAQRLAAQLALGKAGSGMVQDFEREVLAAIAAVRAPKGRRAPKRLRDLARPWLAENLEAFHAGLAGKLQEYEQLHQVRILGKRLRYGMEVFACCFNKDFKDCYYPMVEEMQDILGRANDSHVAGLQLAELRNHLRASQPKLWKRMRAGLEGVLRYHQRRLPQERKQFLRWRTTWLKSGAEKALTEIAKE